MDAVNSLKMKILEPNSLLIRPACSEDYSQIRDFLVESSHIYPDIEAWWKYRVCPELDREERMALVVDSGNSLEGLLIAKPGESAKLCALRLREPVRNQGIGRVLLTEGLNRLLAYNPFRFHVTVSEGAEEGCAAFFESIGFRKIAVQRSRYTEGIDEFIYSCKKDEIREAVDNQLANGLERTLFGITPIQMPCEHTLLMSLRPEFAESILQGRKTIEFRRRFSKKYEGATIVFYISHPVKQFMFTATIAKVDHRQTEFLWNDYHEEGGISQSYFDQYFSGTTYGYAIRLSNVTKIPNQIELEQAKEISPKFRPPQSFQKLQPRSPLVRALQLPVHI